MNPRIPYNPDRRRGGGCASRLAWLIVPAVVAASVFMLRSGTAGGLPPTGGSASPRPAIATLTPAPDTPVPTAEPPTPTLEPPLPTSTFLPPPSPSPTALMTPAPTLFYTTQAGDTLPALAARFGVNPTDIIAPEGLQGTTTLADGQLLVIPRVLGELGPNLPLIPDSELVFSGAGAGFDPQAFALEQGGYLGVYQGYAEGRTSRGGDVLALVARNHSINPRLLVALLEYQSGWVTNPTPASEGLNYPLGHRHPYLRNLNSQLTWAATELAAGYYAWRAGTLTELQFPDGTSLRLDPALNAGTVALQYFFARTLNRPDWDAAIGEQGFVNTYYRLFGDPFERALNPLIPADLQQVPLALPFPAGQTWYYTGGPHGAWERGGAMAALDFAPPSTASGCAESGAWVTAVAAGLVLRSELGVVVLDLDGDGREATGWNILYLHVGENQRVEEGTFVERGDHIGHPSCEGGRATGTHVHIARKYNGEWVLADSMVPFNLNGWVAAQGQGEYLGTLTRDGQVVEACTCTAAYTAIESGP
jgi:murein DD-endopeptidase MepM/ murein hydrolase activator NlpD